MYVTSIMSDDVVACRGAVWIVTIVARKSPLLLVAPVNAMLESPVCPVPSSCILTCP